MNKESLKQELNIEIQREFEYMKFNGIEIEFEYRNSNGIQIQNLNIENIKEFKYRI